MEMHHAVQFVYSSQDGQADRSGEARATLFRKFFWSGY